MNNQQQHMMEIRSQAVATAATALGDPEDYRVTSDRKGPGESAGGVAGALGARATESSSYSSSDYADALIQVAEYITTGRLNRDDLVPEVAAMYAAAPEPTRDDAAETIAIMREARP